MVFDDRYCGGFRLPGCRSINALRQPAAEKRQGTKSREVEHRRGSWRYEDLEEVLDLGNSKRGGFKFLHNLNVLARLMQKRGFNVFDPCDFK
jgi:hypothetical protein